MLQKFEDTELDMKPLPSPKLVPTPNGVPNELFGDVAMITEFLACYKGLLLPEEGQPILTGIYSIHTPPLFVICWTVLY